MYQHIRQQATTHDHRGCQFDETCTLSYIIILQLDFDKIPKERGSERGENIFDKKWCIQLENETKRNHVEDNLNYLCHGTP